MAHEAKPGGREERREEGGSGGVSHLPVVFIVIILIKDAQLEWTRRVGRQPLT
jgi:hypothetical protein